MKKERLLLGTALTLVAGLTLAGCANDSTPASEEKPAASSAPGEEKGTEALSSVTIEDNHGSIEVPVSPEKVVALDNLAFQTLADWDIELAAAPKGVIGDVWPEYSDNDAVLDIGSHREPDLEQLVLADPDLVIGGYRFGEYYDEIKGLVPDAAVIEIEPRDGEDHASELKREVEILGQIFDHEDDAKKINDAFDKAVADAKAAYNGEDTVMALLVSGGEISYVAPVTGRSLGVLFPALDLVPAIEQKAEDTSHGDDIALEAIADANPDWLIVLDRDGGFGEEGYVPAADIIAKAELLQNTTAVQEGNIVVAAPTFYLDEGIQIYTELYEDLAEAFAK